MLTGSTQLYIDAGYACFGVSKNYPAPSNVLVKEFTEKVTWTVVKAQPNQASLKVALSTHE